MIIHLELKADLFADLIKATDSLNKLYFRDCEKLEKRREFQKLPVMEEAHYSKRFQLGFVPIGNDVHCWVKKFSYDDVLSLILSHSCNEIINYEGILTEKENEFDKLA